MSPLHCLLPAVLLSVGCVSAFAGSAAKVDVVDGTVHVTGAAGKRTIVAAGSEIREGDTITSEAASYARLRFTDGSELAIRPSSSLTISAYHHEADQPARDNLVMRLIKGGMRNLTGLIGKRGNPDAYRLNSATATIGIRGTEFVARVCNGDCREEQRRPEVVRRLPMPRQGGIAGRLVGLGSARAIGIDGLSRPIQPGDALFNGDTVVVGAAGPAALVLADETRVVLQAGSEYSIDSVVLNPRQPERDGIATRLLKGAMRVITGLVAKRQPKAVEFSTTVATIGIRGTNFDVWCASDVGSDPVAHRPDPNRPAPCDQAIYTRTREGEIEVSAGGRSVAAGPGMTAFASANLDGPRLLGEAPDFLRELPMPAPESIDVDMKALFGVDANGIDQAGLYVEVKDGKVLLTQVGGGSMLLSKGETGFAAATGTQPYRLRGAPDFMESDLYLRDLRVDPVACRP